MSRTVVVFGASSYVGSHLVRRLLDGGSRVVGIARRPAMARILIPEEIEGLSLTTAEEAQELVGDEPFSIINLAFVKKATPDRLYRQNRALTQAIEAFADRGCERLIHISTAAVFGYRFTQVPEPTRVRWQPSPTPSSDGYYSESKIHAEHLVERLAAKRDCELAIVRLGNVIGPAAPIWVTMPAQRILEGEPVGYDSEPGFSNTTHAGNIADYLAHLADLPAGALGGFGTYHHLAEFSAHRWAELLDVMSEEIGLSWSTVPRLDDDGASAPLVKQALKAAYFTRAGGIVRAGLGVLPEGQLTNRLVEQARVPLPPQLRPPQASIGRSDLLDVLSSAYEFRSSTVPGWEPPVEFSSACSEIGDSLRESRFRLGPGARS